MTRCPLPAKPVCLDWADSRYPERLHARLGSRAPRELWLSGNTALLDAPALAIAGSRRASERGSAVASDCAAQAAAAGITIVSGYAAGIDTAAHAQALRAGGSTVIVLPEGTTQFVVKPELRAVWDEKRVLIVSQFPPDALWSIPHAMTRNRTIVGLAGALVVAEAGAKGGSIAAGRDALRMGTPLFVADFGADTKRLAPGNSTLIAAGAARLTKNKKTDAANMTHVFEAVSSLV